MNFSEHGIFTIEVEDQILLVDAAGPFNDITLVNFQQSLRQAVESLRGQSWQQIIVLHEEGIFTPEAEKILIETMSWRKSMGMGFSAVVIGDAVAKPLIRQQLSRCYDLVGVPHDYFETVANAREHLNNRDL